MIVDSVRHGCPTKWHDVLSEVGGSDQCLMVCM